MIVLKVELHSAVTGKVTTLGSAIISNRGDGSNTRGNYDVRVGNKRDANNLVSVYRKPQRRGEVLDYPRTSYSIWRLVLRALRSVFPEEK